MNAPRHRASNPEKELVAPPAETYCGAMMANQRAHLSVAAILAGLALLLAFLFSSFVRPAQRIDEDAQRFVRGSFPAFLDGRNGWFSDGLWTRAADSYRRDWPVERLAAYFHAQEARLGAFERIVAIRPGASFGPGEKADYRVDYDLECNFAAGRATVSIGLVNQASRWAYDRFTITPEKTSP